MRPQRGAGWPKWIATIALACAVLATAPTAASAETRTLKLYFVHTKERAEITFKRNGSYLQSGLNELNRFLRDWRRNEPTRMDPRLMDLLWETYQSVGARDYIHVVSAYRSPATNSMLRSRSSGVAEKSQHTLGRAVDFFIPGVPVSRLRAAALRLQGGGVGYYPRSGSPFVHIDVGSIRHWPRMNRNELMAVFPDGRSLHVPSDGKPLPGYNQALAAQRSRGGRAAPTVAEAQARPRGFLAGLFGGGADQEEEESGNFAVAAIDPREPGAYGPARRPQRQVAAEQPARPAAAPQPARQQRQADQNLPGIATSGDSAPTPPAPVRERQPEPVRETPETIIAALPPRSVPLPLAAPRPSVDVGPAEAVAAAPAVVAEPESVAAEPEPPVALAALVPLPTRRPEVPSAAPAPELASAASAPAVTAISDTLLTALARARPERGAERAISDVIVGSVPAPAARSEALVDQTKQDMVLAALPAPRPNQLSHALPDSQGDRPAGKVAVAPPTQRSAALSAAETGRAGRVALEGARTTAKAPRPVAADARREARPTVVPAQPADARWAFNNDFVIASAREATAGRVARNIVRTAPETVYTAGFQQAGDEPDTRRFAGNAVNFLSIARFGSN